MLLGAMMTSVSIVKEKERGTMEILVGFTDESIHGHYQQSHSIHAPLLCRCAYYPSISLRCTRYASARKYSITTRREYAVYHHYPFAWALYFNQSGRATDGYVYLFVGLLMPALVFSGFMFPIENMPLPLQVISNVVPTKWYYAIVRSIMVKGLGISYIIKPTLILIGMTVFFIALAMKNFKVRLE